MFIGNNLYVRKEFGISLCFIDNYPFGCMLFQKMLRRFGNLFAHKNIFHIKISITGKMVFT